MMVIYMQDSPGPVRCSGDIMMFDGFFWREIKGREFIVGLDKKKCAKSSINFGNFDRGDDVGFISDYFNAQKKHKHGNTTSHLSTFTQNYLSTNEHLEIK